MIKRKKLNYLFLIGLLMSVLTLSSCGGADFKTIDDKIEKEGFETNFSPGEYDAMIEFIEKLMKEDPQYDSSDEKQFEKFGEDFGRMFNYMMVLGLAEDKGKLSSSQTEKINKIKQIASQKNNANAFSLQDGDGLDDNIGNDDYESSGISQKVIVDLDGNIIGDFIKETNSSYIGMAQDEFEVPKSTHKVIVLNNEKGEGVVFCKEPGDIVKVYALPSLNAPVIGNMIYEEGYLPNTYECIGKELNWYKIRFNHKTGYVIDDSVEWAAEDYF